ncbi:hypothetical protein BT93_J0843 [Corymbia citriodora subsp. variegata]|nr:hypothetical protein BT93_J0843 [Corymbia citriodora subsp. variegata]
MTMTGRKNTGNASVPLLVLLSLVFCFATYNLLTIVMRNIAIMRSVVDDSNGKLLSNPVLQMPGDTQKQKTSGSPFHIALTATDAPYSKWQSRIMYYWYKKKKDLPGSEMGGFTRILHSGNADNLMDEIPTIVVDPLPAGLDRGYIVLNRPWAFVQWLEKATIEEEYILMAEPDHIFVKPLPNLADGGYPAAFPFFYIKPAENENTIRKFFPEKNGPVTNVDPIGNSPVIIKKVMTRAAIPPDNDDPFGWVLEMYAYAVASALHGVKHMLRKDFMLQSAMRTPFKGKFLTSARISLEDAKRKSAVEAFR